MLLPLFLGCLFSNDKPSDPNPFAVFDALQAQNALCTETKVRESWSGETGGYPSYVTNVYECKNVGVPAGPGLALDHFVLTAAEQYTYRHLALNRETSHRYSYSVHYDFVATNDSTTPISVSQINFSTAFAGQVGFSDSARDAAKKLHWNVSTSGPAASQSANQDEQTLQQVFKTLGLVTNAPQEK